MVFGSVTIWLMVASEGTALPPTVTVGVKIIGGTATLGTDFTTNPAISSLVTTLTFAPGDVTKLIDFSALDDGTFDDDETVQFALHIKPGVSPVNAQPGSQGTHTVTIDDLTTAAAPSVTFAALPKYTRSRNIKVDVKGANKPSNPYPAPKHLVTIADLGGWSTVSKKFFATKDKDGTDGLITTIQNASGKGN